jgi:hypothetical protein
VNRRELLTGRKPALERFLAKVNKAGPTLSRSLGPCWLWMGAGHPTGYGRFRLVDADFAHRCAWRLFRGPIPSASKVLHRCDNPLCVNPDHLFLGSDADNVLDRDRKGRGRWLRGNACANSKLNEAQVIQIRQQRSEGVSGAELARQYGVTRSAIVAVVTGKNWRHVPT